MTTTEYDDYGRVVRTITVDEYEERPNQWTYNPPVWYSVDSIGGVTINGVLTVKPNEIE